MSDDDRLRWDRRYESRRLASPAPTKATPTGPANALLADLVACGLATGGRALDLACGDGATAVWLAGCGYQVDAVDISPIALSMGRQRAADAGLDAQTIRWHGLDLDPSSGDATLPGRDYDLVICRRFMPPAALWPQLINALRPGGAIAIEVLAHDDLATQGRRFRARPGALLHATAGLLPAYYREGRINGETVARLIARRARVNTSDGDGDGDTSDTLAPLIWLKT